MKTLLVAVNAKYIHSNLAVRSLKAFAAAYGDQIALAEFTINQDPDYMLREIYQQKPDFIGFSCYIWNIRIIRELAASLRLLLPAAAIWAGGPEVSYDSRAFLAANPAFTGVMRGEGERIFLSLMDWYQADRGSLEQIQGITWRTQKKEIRENPGETGYLPMDEIPFVYSDMTDFSHRIIYYESSRGCPFSCSYCLSSIDKRVRLRSLSLVLHELAFFLERQVPQVKFVDRTFNCSKAHTRAVWQYILEHDNGVTNFHFEIAADLLDEEELALLAKMRPGLVQLEIGVQSVQEKTLEAIHRKTDFSKIRETVNRISRGRNVHQHLDLIAGLPGETYALFRESFNQVYALKPQELQLGFLKVLKGSPLWMDAEKYGIVYRQEPVYEVLATRWLSFEELSRLKEIEQVLEIYYNSQQFIRTMEFLEQQFDDAFTLYEELAAYYREHGFQEISLSRMQRLEALHSFCLERDPGHLGEYEERLVLDLYLRENAKTRPEWAGETVTQKEKLEFFRREQDSHRYLPEEDYGGYTYKQLARMVHAERLSGSVILFDYKNRDPLTYDAQIRVVEDGDWPSA